MSLLPGLKRRETAGCLNSSSLTALNPILSYKFPKINSGPITRIRPLENVSMKSVKILRLRLQTTRPKTLLLMNKTVSVFFRTDKLLFGSSCSKTPQHFAFAAPFEYAPNTNFVRFVGLPSYKHNVNLQKNRWDTPKSSSTTIILLIINNLFCEILLRAGNRKKTKNSFMLLYDFKYSSFFAYFTLHLRLCFLASQGEGRIEPRTCETGKTCRDKRREV